MRDTSLRIALAFFGVIANVIALGAGPAVGSPIKINKCTTITKPGSYVVTRNLTADGDCLVITAGPVDIDLDGWVITSRAGTGVGIRGARAVRNGTITGFDVGVALVNRAVIENVRAVDNNVGGISVGAQSIVMGNIADGIPTSAIRAGPGSIVSGNIATGGDNIGIRVGERSIVTDNVVPNATTGLVAGPISTVSGNTANGFEGAIIVQCPSNVIGNTAEGELRLIGEGCTNIDNLVIPETPE